MTVKINDQTGCGNFGNSEMSTWFTKLILKQPFELEILEDLFSFLAVVNKTTICCNKYLPVTYLVLNKQNIYNIVTKFVLYKIWRRRLKHNSKISAGKGYKKKIHWCQLIFHRGSKQRLCLKHAEIP